MESALSWYVPGIVAQITLHGIMALVFSYLYVHDRKPFLILWGIGSLGWVLARSFSLVIFQGYEAAAFLIIQQTGALMGGFFLCWGTMDFIGRKLPKPWTIWFWFTMGWIVLLVFLQVPLNQVNATAPMHLMMVPMLLGQPVIHFWAGLAFLKAGNIRATGQRITGGAFFLTGLHLADYPLLRNVEWFVPWGYLIANALSFIIAIGILVAYYQQIITERIKAEEDMLRMEKSRVHLLTNISHDLRTPLSTVQGYVKAMLDQVVSKPEEQSEYLNLIYNRVLKINRMIQDLFDLAQLESRRVKLNLEQVAVNDLISQLFDKYRVDVLNAGLSFNLNSPGPREPDTSEVTPFVEVDPDQIERVFANLIYNAVKHTPRGGKVAVGYEIVEVDGARASRARTGTGAGSFEALVNVTDTGAGISPEELPYIFDRYYKGAAPAGKATGGAGLGLAISKEIIEYHNGRIWAESVLGQGSTFSFTLPVIGHNFIV